MKKVFPKKREKQNKTKRIEIRVTEKVFDKIKKKAVKFRGITPYIMTALAEFSDTSIDDCFERQKELLEFYRQTQKYFSSMSSNINQIAKHLNIMSLQVSTENDKLLFLTQQSKTLTDCRNVLSEVQEQLYDLTKERSKLKYPKKFK